MSHLVWPAGPDCASECPGDWSDWHDGYASGLERGIGTSLLPDDGMPVERLGLAMERACDALGVMSLVPPDAAVLIERLREGGQR